MTAVAERRRRRAPGFKDVVLAVAAILGLAAVGWTVYSQTTGATIVVLKTGSMSPAMPQGSGAVSMPTDAADLEIGDVVTVRLDDASLPVTHRIVGIDGIADTPNARELTLRGDANDTDDLYPYVVERVLRVAMPLPHAGAVLSVLTAPWFLGGMVLVIGALMAWAFWPGPLEEIEQELAEREHMEAETS